MLKWLSAGVAVLSLVALALALDERGEPRARPADARRWARVFAPGRVEGATREIELRPQLAGPIAAVAVAQGQTVRRGDLLLQLDDAPQRHAVLLAEAELAHAQAELNRLLAGARDEEKQEAAATHQSKLAALHGAQQRLRRLQTLTDQRTVSQQETDDQAALVESLVAEAAAAEARLRLLEAPAREDEVHISEAEVSAAEARLKQSRHELEQTRLTAPCHGQVLDVRAEPGEWAGPQSVEPSVLLADTTRLFVRAFVEEYDAPRIAVGMTAEAAADGLPDQKLTGKVVRLSPRMTRKLARSDLPGERLDTEVREVWIELEGAPSLVVGLRVDVTILTPEARP